jgi:hypothetical protein
LTSLPRQKIVYPLYFTFHHLALLASSKMNVNNAEVGMHMFSLHSPLMQSPFQQSYTTYCTKSILCHVQGILASRSSRPILGLRMVLPKGNSFHSGTVLKQLRWGFGRTFCCNQKYNKSKHARAVIPNSSFHSRSTGQYSEAQNHRLNWYKLSIDDVRQVLSRCPQLSVEIVIIGY